ncbi:MAG: PocR ligand-binding domain-containing protein [Deltaproteobacteria bacterium]
MNYKLSDLIELDPLEKLVDHFSRIIGLPLAITNADGKLLLRRGGEDLCLKFHRTNGLSLQRCLKSDALIMERWREGPYIGYRCLNGLMEYAAPIVVENQHMGTVFTGQILHEPPDESYFRRQAAELGFPMDKYMAALRRVPIIPKPMVEPFIMFLAHFGEVLAVMGLDRLRLLETQKSLLEAQELMEDKIRERTAELHEMGLKMQNLSRELMRVQEDERRRLARELHDEVGQALTVVKINLQSLLQTNELPPERLQDSINIVDDTLQDIRNLAMSLRPALLDDLGLDAALHNYLATYSQRTGLATELNCCLDGKRLSRDLETACFRVTQEALTNVLRHSHASLVRVGVSTADSELLLTISDDGRGFDVTAATGTQGKSMGLLGMRERAAQIGGHMYIESKPGGGGTRVVAVFPLLEE